VKVAIVLGTRPEIIKMAPIIKFLEERGEEYLIFHTGQHYDFNLDRVFFDEFKLRQPDVNLNVGSGSHGETTGKIIMGLERAYVEKRPDLVLVNGDTNTTMAGALAAVKLHILCGHVEAGIRNYDRRMPEEYNRIVADHVSDYLFATSKLTERNLTEESITRNVKYLYFQDFKGPRIFLTGNTIVDVVYALMKQIDPSAVHSRLGLRRNDYFYLTVHREENVDYKERLGSVLKGLQMVSKEFDLPMVFPVHPRTRTMIEKFGLMNDLNKIRNLKLIEPLGYFDHLALESNARLVLTDSGGVQEETCTLKVPGVVLREVTDRPEGIEVGATMLSGLEPDKIMQVTRIMMQKERDWVNPYGDGHASERIVDIIGKT
jgi:UDP-N-acetylglucosamine 2-epimerase (non-hydrolysing)